MFTLSRSVLASCALALSVLASDETANISVKPTCPVGFSITLFEDDFSHGISPLKWTYDLGTSYDGGPPQWGTGEIQTYTNHKSNIDTTPYGTLKITPRVNNGSWTSARIETTAVWDFSCRRGERVRAEARLKLGTNPPSQSLGIWPAFWSIGSALRGNYQNWPAVGEIDILESINADPRTFTTVHCGIAPGGPCNEFSGLGSSNTALKRGVWQTIAVEIDRRHHFLWPAKKNEESIRWYVNDKLQWTLKQSELNDTDAWAAVVGNPKMLLLNVAVGGSFPDAIAGMKTPTNETLGGDGAALEVDYVGVYAGVL